MSIDKSRFPVNFYSAGYSRGREYPGAHSPGVPGRHLGAGDMAGGRPAGLGRKVAKTSKSTFHLLPKILQKTKKTPTNLYIITVLTPSRNYDIVLP